MSNICEFSGLKAYSVLGTQTSKGIWSIMSNMKEEIKYYKGNRKNN